MVGDEAHGRPGGPAPSGGVAKKFRDVKRILRVAGWERARTSGSHEVWVHWDGRRVVVPGGGKDGREVPAGTLGSIRRATGLDELR